MKVNFGFQRLYINIKEYEFVLLPTIGVGYCNKFLSISLYILAWEFFVCFNWEE